MTISAKDLLKKALKDIGADGLWNGQVCGEDACGCSLDDIAACGDCNLEDCEPAKQKDDGYFYPIKTGKA